MTGKADRQNSAHFTLTWFGPVFFVSMAILVAWLYVNRASAESAGLIELSDFQVQLDGAMLDLQLNAQISLSPTVQAGLNSGVPLTFVISADILQPKRWWPDETVVDFQQRYTLTYYDLTRHYRVTAVNTDESRNFRSLSSALVGLGEMVHIQAELDAEQLDFFAQKGLLALVSMQLSRSALPLPLQPIIRGSWTLVSEDYRWQVT